MTTLSKSLLLFFGGVLFGTAGIKILSSRDAKKVYRAKDCVAKTATTIQENAEDILAEAKQINAEREKGSACEVKDEEIIPVSEENSSEKKEEANDNAAQGSKE